MNRYTQLSPSQFSPLSLEEIMLVPSMKRKQHDDLLAKQEMLRGELAKVDPLDVHLDEAVRLREEMNNKINSQAEQLAKSGIDPNSQGQFLALNREYQNLTGPTGRIGQINQAKKLYDTERARFLESASKQYGSKRALELWDNHQKDYIGYEDPEKTKIKYIDSKGILSAQDFQADLKDFNSLLGSTMSEVSRGGGSVVYDEELGGYRTTNSNMSQSTKNNINQLNEMKKVLKSKWIDQGGEGTLYNQEAGIDLDNFNNRFNSAINMQSEQATSFKKDNSVSFNPDGSKNSSSDENGSSNYEVIPSGEIENTAKDVESIKKKALTIGKLTGSDYTTDASGAPIPSSQRNISPDEVFKKGSYERKLYDSAYKLSKSKKISLEQAIDLKAKEFESVILKPDIIQNQNLFPSMLVTKDIKLRDANLKKDVAFGSRKLYDPKTGKEVMLDKDDLKDSDFEYYGMLSPINLKNNKMKTEDQKISPHYVLINGETYLMGRTSTEMNTSNFQKVKKINKVWNDLVTNSDEVITAPESWGKLSGLKMKYNSTDVNAPIEILDNSGKVVGKTNVESFVKFISKDL